MSSGNEIVIPSDQEEQEYQLLLERLNREFPPASAPGFDFSKIVGNLTNRTAKTIILHLTTHGWNDVEIADKLQVTVYAVRRYLLEALREISTSEDLELIRKHELLKLDAVERSAHEQFVRSCDDEETEVATWVIEVETASGCTLRKEVPEGTPGAEQVMKRTRKGQSGNPAYLRAILDVAKQRDQLLGLAKPKKLEVNKTSKTLHIKEIVVHNAEEVQAARAAGLLK